jgi:hypothetical protein
MTTTSDTSLPKDSLKSIKGILGKKRAPNRHILKEIKLKLPYLDNNIAGI